MDRIKLFDRFVNESRQKAFEIIYTLDHVRGTRYAVTIEKAIKAATDLIKMKDANGKHRVSEVEIFRGGVFDSTDETYLIKWWDTGNNYWSNMAKKNPELLKKRLEVD